MRLAGPARRARPAAPEPACSPASAATWPRAGPVARVRRASPSGRRRPGPLAPAGTSRISYSVDGAPAPWWVAHQGGRRPPGAGQRTTSSCSTTRSTGTFEFSVDAYHGPLGRGLAHARRPRPRALPAGTDEPRSTPSAATRRSTAPGGSSRPNDFNRAHGPGRARQGPLPGQRPPVLRGRRPEPDQPLARPVHADRAADRLAELALRGKPTIPREVRLSHADRLEGWVSSFYNETQPRGGRRPGPTRTATSIAVPYREPARRGKARPAQSPINPDDFDWAARDGVILGRRLLTTSPNRAGQPRRLLRRGRQLRRRPEPALLLPPAARRRRPHLRVPLRARPGHGPPGARPAGLPARARRRPAPLDDHARRTRPPACPPTTRSTSPPTAAARQALAQARRVERAEAGARRRHGHARRSTAGRSTSARSKPANSRQFGLYHDKDRTSVQVRNVVLRGRLARVARRRPRVATWRPCRRRPSVPRPTAAPGTPSSARSSSASRPSEVLARAREHDARGAIRVPGRLGPARAPTTPSSASRASSRRPTPRPPRTPAEATGEARRAPHRSSAARSARRPSSWSTRPRRSASSTSWPPGSTKARADDDVEPPRPARAAGPDRDRAATTTPRPPRR